MAIKGLNENILKRIAQDEGLPSSTDLYEFYNCDFRDDDSPFIKLHMEIDSGNWPIVEPLYDLLAKTTDIYSRVLLDELIRENKLYESSPLSRNIIDYMERTRLIFPKFDIYSSEQASELLPKMNQRASEIFEERNKDGFIDLENDEEDEEQFFARETIRPDSLLLVFNLPKPLSQYWFKSDNQLRIRPHDPQLGIIKWGNFYENLMGIIYDMVSKASNKKLSLFRLNGNGVHAPDQFYYVWAVTKD